MKPGTRNPKIPQDIIIEIFSWLPVKSLMQFRCVSKCFKWAHEELGFHFKRRRIMEREIESLDCDLWFDNKVCIRGIIYMLDYWGKIIVAFNIKAENFRIIRLENVLYNPTSHYKLLEVKGKLVLLDYYKCFSGQKDLWILENFEKEEWKSHSIQIPSQWKGMEDKLRPTFSDCKRFCCSYNDEIVFIAIKTNILECNFYDLRKLRWRYLEIQGVPTEDVIYAIHSYAESLYSLEKNCNTCHQVSFEVGVHRSFLRD
ncbi:putative F-box protein At2g19630 [Nicotiana sylvestris]|uniref:putative F-box protein At2g19630 n=1 Tax=Nicotiana sylvestris TaxID=4096 RepID=UPI00388CB9A8